MTQRLPKEYHDCSRVYSDEEDEGKVSWLGSSERWSHIRDKRTQIEPTIQKIGNFIRNIQILRLGCLKTAALMIQAQLLDEFKSGFVEELEFIMAK